MKRNKKKPTDADPSTADKKRSAKARHLVLGGFVSSDFFVKHWLTIFILLLLVTIFISTKYQCQTGMETIKRLSNDLEIIKTERIRQRSTYMSRIRESEMQALADSVKPGLRVQEQPPYHLNQPGQK